MPQWLIITLLVVLAIVILVGLWASLRARRLDGIQTNVQKSRFVLEHALNARSRASIEVAKSGALDAAGAVLLLDIAREANDASIYPIVDDGLDAITIEDEAGKPLLIASQSARPDRLDIESELSRVLRLVVDDMDSDDFGYRDEELFERLEKTRDNVRLTRRFHNIHVANARRVRRSRLARIFRIHGNSALPRTVDLDDE